MTEPIAVFLVSCVFLFFGMPLDPNVFDEGIMLTASMRVATAGQVPDRDFYYNYGPAQVYILGGLFKLFGESLFVERLYDLFLRALLATAVYAFASRYCSRVIALCTAGLTLLWLYALYQGTVGSAVIPSSVLNLISVALVLPLFNRDVSMRRMAAVGAVTGMAALFRYDTGLALLGIDACIVAAGIWLRLREKRLRAIVLNFAPCLLGFVAVTLPVAIFYFFAVPYEALVYDIILYPTKYYHAGRNLPFPRITWSAFGNIEIYLLIAAIGVSFYAAWICYRRARNRSGSGFLSRSEEQRWLGYFAAFGLLALLMYFKGFVRVSNVQLYLAIVASMPILAAVIQRRFVFSGPARISMLLLVALSVSAAVWSCYRETLHIHWAESSVPGNMVSFMRGSMPEIRTRWCKVVTPLTKDVCFFPDDEHIEVVEFIDSHTTPDQRLFVGLPRHDRIFANDNLIYFATQRLPATKWSQFDPLVVNSTPVQAEMVRELEATAPPYIVLDSEFDKAHEPNASSTSSGVVLLDEYIHKKYRFLEAFGEMSVWERIPAA